MLIGAVAFIHHFGSSMNGHVHFHLHVVDEFFEEVVSHTQTDDVTDATTSPPSVILHLASKIDEITMAQVQATLCKRILFDFMGRGLIENCHAKEMPAYQLSGSPVNAGGCIEAHDLAALKCLLRYDIRPPFDVDRLRNAGSDFVYHYAKQHSEPTTDKHGAKADEITLTPLETIEKISIFMPRSASIGVATLACCHHTRRDVPAAVPTVWWADVHHQGPHVQSSYPANTGTHQGGV